MSLWNGRFDGIPSEIMLKLGESISVDIKMWKEDIEGSLAHLEMLFLQKIIIKPEYEKIKEGLVKVSKELESGWIPDISSEDIHMAIEGRLHEIIGSVAGKLHTARSRNDQVSTDLRLYLRKKIKQIKKLVSNLVFSLSDKAVSDGRVLVPGYTHLQQAQPIWFGHQLLSHAWCFSRDIERLNDCYKRMNRNPLGSAALAGTTFDIDRFVTTEILEFDSIIQNSMDAISSRDHIQEMAACLAILFSNLSRLSSEIIIWSSKEFSRVKLSDDWSTGSSIMPQKRNPDAAEIIRGKTGRVYGSLMSLLTLTKGLPMAYNRDLQEDRFAIFDSIDNAEICLKAIVGCITSMSILEQEKLDGEFLLSTEIADYLSSKGVPFRSSHSITGTIVKYCEGKKIKLNDLSISEYKKFSDKFEKDIYEWLVVENAVERRNSEGGTSWSQIVKQTYLLKNKLKKLEC